MEQRCIRPLQRRGRHGNPRRRTWTGGAGWQESRGNQWGIYASHAFVERFGRPVSPDNIERFKVIGLVRDRDLTCSSLDEGTCVAGKCGGALRQYSERPPCGEVGSG